MQIDLSGEDPDPKLLPSEEVEKILCELFSDKEKNLLQVDKKEWIEAFRKEIAKFLQNRGFVIGEDELLITNGVKEGIYLLSDLFSQNSIGSEEPTSPDFISTMNFRGIRTQPVPWDEEGLMTEVLEKRLKALKIWADPIKYLYVTTVNNPTGLIMTRERKKTLLEIATDFDLTIVEDDTYGSLTYDITPQPSLKSLDKEDRVIYVSSLSKLIFPGIRLGVLVAQGENLKKLISLKKEINRRNSSLDQLVFNEMLRRGIVESLMEKSRLLYRRKRDLVFENIVEHFPSYVSCIKAKGGLSAFCRGERPLPLKELDIKVDLGEKFFFSPDRGSNSFRLSFSRVGEDEVGSAIRELGEAIRALERTFRY
ncbi:MAG: PLP-dependent aminotransferase family protein [Metallosphaera sp.]